MKAIKTIFNFLKRITSLVFKIFLILFLIFSLTNFWESTFLLINKNLINKESQKLIKPVYAFAGQYYPTGGNLVVGTNTTITSGATSGNVGSWRGLLASDNFYWTVDTVAASPSLDQRVYIDGVELNGANKMIITIRANAGATTLSRFYQICDWTSSSFVDNPADSECTGGGWRTLNIKRVGITGTSLTTYNWHLYNGYWTTSASSNTPVNTPISNFIRSTDGRVLLRAYSTSNVATTHLIDYIRIDVVVDPVYMPAGFTQLSGDIVLTSYIYTINGTVLGQSASDNTYLAVPGTASAISDFYLSFKNIKLYQGANTILVRAEHSCSTTGINYRFALYNFSTASWEDLTGDIACATGDAVNVFAKNNVNLNNYLSNGEARIRMYGLTANALSLRLDFIYLAIGSVNDDATQCEVSFGTEVGGTTCANTRDINTLTTPSTWQQTTELESTSMTHDYYALDNDADATSGEAAAASNLWFPVTIPSNSLVTGIFYANYWRSNSTAITTRWGIKDFSGQNSIVNGGWTLVGTTNAATTYSYQDATVQNYILQDPFDYIDTVNNRINLRLRTYTSTATTNVTRDIDFAMVSIQWIESEPSSSITCSLSASTTTFSALSPSEVSISSPNITLTATTSNAAGLTIYVKDAGNETNPGLYKSTSPTYLIQSADANLSAGTDGYGIQAATTTAGSGGTLTLNSKYYQTGNDVGGFSLINVVLASSTSAVNGREVIITHKAAVSPLAPTGNYQDTITYSCVNN